jgi:FAD/FMN-containing dehydrogenase
LLGRVLGEVIRPADQTYDDARQVWNTAYDRYPALIVRAADAADVLRGVEFARDQDLPLAIRSGGHSFAGFGTVDGGVVLDLSRMKGISIDPARGTAWVQPGATTGDLAPQASRYGLTLPTGDVKSVAIGGLTLGGGIGFLVRKHGLTIDHLLSIELVTADGRLVTASADENPEPLLGGPRRRRQLRRGHRLRVPTGSGEHGVRRHGDAACHHRGPGRVP